MSAKTCRLIAILCFVLAVVVAVLNLQRTANLGLKSMPVLLILLGAVHLNRARKLERQKP